MMGFSDLRDWANGEEVGLAQSPGVPGIILGCGPAMRSLNAVVSEIAASNIPVLIIGECGTGKDVYARLIHHLSQRNECAFDKINCTSPSLAGYSHQLRVLTDEPPTDHRLGSLYFDGVQDLDVSGQHCMLSYLRDREDHRSVSGFGRRIISSANADLGSAVESGQFRRELYFRISGACLRLPPLRERKEDIPAMLEYLLNKHASACNKVVPTIAPGALKILLAYSWPGNILQLESFARKVVTLGDLSLALDEIQIRQTEGRSPQPAGNAQSLRTAVRAVSKQAERRLIIQALERTRWNRKRAAQELQISYKSFLNKLKAIETSQEGQ
jgi:two-component system response regulator AtoC